MADFTFDEIPLDWVEPGTYLEARPNYAQLGLLPYPVKNLIIGQILSTGSLKEGEIVEVVNADDAISLFGAGSSGAEMVKAFRAGNSTQPLYVTGLPDDVSGVAAAGSLAFNGAVSAAAVLRFKIGGRAVKISVAAKDDMPAIATKLAAAISQDDAMPVKATAAIGTVSLTAKHTGELGNDIDFRVDSAAAPLPPGFDVTVTAMSGGAGNPDVNKALDSLAQNWFTSLSCPWTDKANMEALALWLDEQFKAMSKRDCLGFVARRAGFSEAVAWGKLTNCAFLSAAPIKASPTSSWQLAASLQGIAAKYLADDPARQLRTLVLPNVQAPDSADQWTEQERDLLLRNGCSSLTCTAEGAVTISRIITTYRHNNLGTADRAWLDIMTPATVSRIRYDWAAFISLNYPRSKLADDDDTSAFAGRLDSNGLPDNAVVTPGRMKASWAGRCALYANQAWIIDVDQTIRDSIFERLPSDKNRMQSRQHINIIGNLMVFAGSLEFRA
ncbi:MAG: phage tail protein [Candidatus Tokpelaia sp.]|nr:MAG: phage tail protein [Candidatus Tokpelaia sp.]KAA6205722.1 MAG: phage tail protein [Candidatus Tokpelaia sp.]